MTQCGYLQAESSKFENVLKGEADVHAGSKGTETPMDISLLDMEIVNLQIKDNIVYGIL